MNLLHRFPLCLFILVVSVLLALLPEAWLQPLLLNTLCAAVDEPRTNLPAGVFVEEAKNYSLFRTPLHATDKGLLICLNRNL